MYNGIIETCVWFTLSFYGIKFTLVFKVVDYSENKLPVFMNMYCMKQTSPTCATDNQNPLELHVLWRFCVCVSVCMKIRMRKNKSILNFLNYLQLLYYFWKIWHIQCILIIVFKTYHCHILKHFTFYFRLTSSSVDLTFWPPLCVEQWTLIMLNIPSCSSFQC